MARAWHSARRLAGRRGRIEFTWCHVSHVTDELLAAFNDAGELDFLKTGEGSKEAPTVMAETKLEEGPGTHIGRYKLLQKIGEGGMGVVYMAEQEEPVRRRVAFKIIKLGMEMVPRQKR